MDEDVSSQWQQPHCQCCLGANCLESFSTDNCYEDMLWNVFSIFVASDLGGKQICTSCVQSLQDAANFKALVLKSQQTLQTTVQVVKDESKSNIRIKREDSPDGKEGDFLFEVPGTSAIKTEASTQRVRAETKLPSDGAGGGKRRAVTRKRGKKPAKEISTGDVSAGSSDDAVSPDVATERKKTKKKAEDQPEIATGWGESAIQLSHSNIRDKYHRERQMKLNTMKLLNNSNMCPFRYHKNKYQCFTCSSTFTDIALLRQHFVEHSHKDVESVITRYNVVLHHKVDISNLKCKTCAIVQNSLLELREHLVNEHSLMFEDAEDLLIPYKLGDEFKCVICVETLSCFQKLNEHMKKHFSNHICETCGAAFISKTNFKMHTKRHLGNITYACQECELTFTNVYERDRHNSAAHKKTNRVCPHCPERFNGHYRRLQHLIKEHGVKKPEYKCNFCDRVFFRQYLLNVHVRKFHMKEKKHGCEVCAMKFFSKYDLKQHMTSHTGAKNYACHMCEKSYARRTTLTEHMRTHTLAT